MAACIELDALSPAEISSQELGALVMVVYQLCCNEVLTLKYCS